MGRSSEIGQFCPLSHQQFSKGCSSMPRLTAQTQAFPSPSSCTLPLLALHPAILWPPGMSLGLCNRKEVGQLSLRSAQVVIGFYTWDTAGLRKQVCRGAQLPWLRGNIKSPPGELGTQCPHPFKGFTQLRKPPLVNPSPDWLKSRWQKEVKCCYCKAPS